jgi:membrane protein YdbS with pleckstrin-like domain
MKKNMAVLDRFLRLAIAIVLLVLLFTVGFASPWNYVFTVLAILFAFTAIAGICPIYTLLHIDTRQFKETPVSYKGKSV